MVVNDANIIVIGSSYVVKYLFNTSSLSTNEINKNDEVYFENPAKQNLNFAPNNFPKLNSFSVAPKKKPLGFSGRYFLVVFNSTKIISSK